MFSVKVRGWDLDFNQHSGTRRRQLLLPQAKRPVLRAVLSNVDGRLSRFSEKTPIELTYEIPLGTCIEKRPRFAGTGGFDPNRSPLRSSGSVVPPECQQGLCNKGGCKIGSSDPWGFCVPGNSEASANCITPSRWRLSLLACSKVSKLWCHEHPCLRVLRNRLRKIELLRPSGAAGSHRLPSGEKREKMVSPRSSLAHVSMMAMTEAHPFCPQNTMLESSHQIPIRLTYCGSQDTGASGA